MNVNSGGRWDKYYNTNSGSGEHEFDVWWAADHEWPERALDSLDTAFAPRLLSFPQQPLSTKTTSASHLRVDHLRQSHSFTFVVSTLKLSSVHCEHHSIVVCVALVARSRASDLI